jgi:hypothetical protein
MQHFDFELGRMTLPNEFRIDRQGWNIIPQFRSHHVVVHAIVDFPDDVELTEDIKNAIIDCLLASVTMSIIAGIISGGFGGLGSFAATWQACLINKLSKDIVDRISINFPFDHIWGEWINL